ncbi:LuxR C-terminal-related transcriptional regulator [Enterobacter hormaechei]
MSTNTLFLIRHRKISARSRLRLGVLTENSYLHKGISIMAGYANVLSEAIDVIAISAQQWLLFPECCDVLITERQTKNALLLLPLEHFPAGTFLGCDVLPDSLFSALHILARYSNSPLRWYAIFNTNASSPRERELLILLSRGVSTKQIAKTGGFTVNGISYFKQAIKRKVGCRRDAELIFALAQVRQMSAVSEGANDGAFVAT